jgi:putative addiction module component (TIGR02574 family)
MTRQQLLSEAMSLETEEREALAEELLLSLDEPSRARLDAAWLEECHARHAAYERGEVKSMPVDQVIANILSRDRK